MSGLLLSSDNVYGLVNPPPDPVNDLPELHQTIGSAAVRWDYFVDLSNNIGDRLIAGENVTITGNVISVQVSSSSSGSGSTTDSSGSTVSSSTAVVSRAQLTNVDLCNNRLIELTFDKDIKHLETYDLTNFQVTKGIDTIGLGEVYIKDNKVNLSLDYSANAVLDGSNVSQMINPNNLSGQVYFETFNDTKHIGNFQTEGTFESGVNNIGHSKKGVSGEGLFNLTTSDIPNGVKAISFWVKDYECVQETWFLVSDIVRLNGLAIEVFVDSTNTLAGYGENLKTMYVDGNQHTLAPRNSNLPFTLFDITPSLNTASFTGWHHVYIESKTTFADIELLSRNGSTNSLGSLDEIRMYDRALTETEIKGLAIPPYLTTMSDLSNILIKYTRDLGTKDNLKTATDEEIQHFIYFNGTEYYVKEILSYLRRVDISLNQIVNDISDLSQNVNVRLDDLSGALNQTIGDLSTNVNIRLENLSQKMTESIVPLVTDVSLNEGRIEIHFTKDVSNQPTYDINNFMVLYDDANQNYNSINIENGNVVLKNITELGGGTALLTGPNSTIYSGQSYTASTQQTSTTSTATKAFDGQLTGQSNNTWKSNDNVYREVILKTDLSYQSFFEDFEDQAIVGTQTTATIVAGGRDGAGYALQGDNTQDGKVWWQTTSDSLPNNVTAISFWHYAVEEGGADIPQLLGFENADYVGMDLIGANVKYYVSNGSSKFSKWCVDGVDKNINLSSDTYVDTTLDTWHHHYMEFANSPTELKWFGKTLTEGTRYRGTGKLDEIRMFSKNLTIKQVKDIHDGDNGNVIPDLPTQTFFEDFEDQSYTGNVTQLATIVSGGYNSDYALQGSITQRGRWQMNNMTSFKSASFWMYLDVDNLSSNSTWVFEATTHNRCSLHMINSENRFYVWNSDLHYEEWWINGVKQPLTTSTGHNSNPSSLTYTTSQWIHIYLQWNTNKNSVIFMGATDNLANQYDQWGNAGKIDDVRFFENALNSSQIAHLSSGGNGDIGLLNNQSFFEDFEDNAYEGSHTSANIVDITGHTGTTTKAVHTERDNTKIWRQPGLTNVKNVSFWVYFNSRPTGFGTSFLTILDPNNASNWVTLWMGSTSPNNNLVISSNGTFSSKTYAYYINGVQNSNTDISNNSWNHISFNIQEGIDGTIHWCHHYIGYENDTSLYLDTYIDEVRFFNDVLSQQQITDVSNNNLPSTTFSGNPTSSASGISGEYLGTQITQGYSGEWVQVDMGGSSTPVINTFTIKPQQNTNDAIVRTHPGEFKMFASNNSSTWNEINYTTGLSGDTWFLNNAFNNYTVSLSSPAEYRYWRLVVGKTVNGAQVSIGEIDFNGSIITNNAYHLNDVNKLEIAYKKNADSSKNLVDLIGGGEINEFIYKGLGLTNITRERLTDLSDVSVNSIIDGQFVKFDGTHFVPTNDISDISQNLADEISRAITKEANIDGAINTINTQILTLMENAPATLDTLKEIADVLGDPTDASGGIGSMMNKIQTISDELLNLSNQSSGAVGDLESQTTAAINDLSTNIFNKLNISDKKQTFFEMLTQQPATFSPSGEITATAGDVNINWTYDNILANTDNTTLAKLAFQNTLKQKNLPFIDSITIEISGNISTGNNSYDNNSNQWITFTTGIWPKTFSNTEDYNTTQYKTLTIDKVSQEQANSNSINNILSKTDPFDVRIYGSNYAEDVPTVDNRSLYFYDLSFVTALAPSIPQFSTENAISSDNSITFNYYVQETELNAPASNGVLIDASNTYFDFESTSSTVAGTAVTNTNIQTNTNISNVAKDTNYSISINSLKAGTKYKFFTAARNNLTSTTSYSSNSSTITSSFTRTPSSSGSTPASSWFNPTTYAYKISTPTGGSWTGDDLNNTYACYLNKSNNSSLSMLNSTRTFEVSLPYSSTQQNTQGGFGKFIDNSSNLTEITFSIDGTEKQEILYGGFGVNPTLTNKNGNTVNYFSSPTMVDPHNNNSKRKGFRLNGSFGLIDILHSNINVPSTTGYSLNYAFDKHSDVGGNSVSKTFKVYIDELAGNPTITKSGTETYLTNISYCMGIPSAQTFDISFARVYNNVNSQYQYTRYHTSSPAGITVGLIYSVSKTNRSSSNYSGKINIGRGDIVSNGTYSFNSSDIDTKTSNRFRDIYFTQTVGMPTSSNDSPGDSLSINERSFNLNGEENTNTSLSFTYYCDYSSFNKSSSRITTPILSITNVAEITDMTVFNSQLNTISTSSISNHEQLMNDWTLLFIEGKFKSNQAQRYPNVAGYTWTKPPGEGNFTSQLTYNSGGVAYYTNGSTTGSGNKYKWIAFKFTESNATTTTVAGIQYTYLNVYNLLSQNYYFSSTILGYLKNSSNSNVLGFIQQSYNGSARIGNLSRGYSPSAIWYSQDAGDTFDNIFEGENKSNYGCVFEQSSSSWGPILDTTNGATDITIYIGFNNDVSLG
jgi:hypothetical protein